MRSDFAGAAVRIRVRLNESASIVVRGFAVADCGDTVSVATIPTDCGLFFGKVRVPASAVCADDGKE